MTLTNTNFPVDFTGESPDNRIAGELHTLSNKLVRVISPIHGPFYRHRLILTSVSENRELVEGVDYRPTSILTNLSVMAEKDVYQAIVILNPDIQGDITVDYQTVGWLYEGDNSELAEFLENNLKPNRRVAWDLIESSLPELSDEYKDLIKNSATRYGALVVELDRIAQFATLSNVRSFESLRDGLLGQIQDALDLLYEHIDDKSNIHGLTLEQADMYENEVIDHRFSEIPIAPTELLQRPWTTGDKILYRNMNPKSFNFLSTSYLGTETASSTLSRLTVKEMDFKSPLFSDRTIPATLANSSSDIPGSSSTYHNAIHGDTESPILETRTYDKSVLTLTTTDAVGKYPVIVVARDHLGNESLESEFEFEVKEPLPANMSGFQHNVPRLFDQNQTIGSIRFWGAKSATGGPVTYSIESVTPNRVSFSKSTNLGENEYFSMTAGPVSEAEFLVDLVIKVRITNNIDTLSFVEIPTSIVARRNFDVMGGNTLNWTVPGDGRWRIVVVGGGGNSSGNTGGGGAGVASGIYSLKRGDRANIIAGLRTQASSFSLTGSTSLNLIANPGNTPGSGGTASGGMANTQGTSGTSGYSYSVTLQTPKINGSYSDWVANRNKSNYTWYTPPWTGTVGYFYPTYSFEQVVNQGYSDPAIWISHFNEVIAPKYISYTVAEAEGKRGTAILEWASWATSYHHSHMRYNPVQYRVTGGPSYSVTATDSLPNWSPPNRILEYLTNTTLFFRLEYVNVIAITYEAARVRLWMTRTGARWSASEIFPYSYSYQENRYASGSGGYAQDNAYSNGLVSGYGSGGPEGGYGNSGIVRVRYEARV